MEQSSICLMPKGVNQRILQSTIWRDHHKRLNFKAHKVQLLQALSEENKVRRVASRENFIQQVKQDKTLDLPSATKAHFM